ncbi:MoaD/ThiS family protein [Saccharospirillum mangrovi]|uniref:MoaD/ThiS family protein n=1 Tax=Saccharospirillum mangrovi TaxID=2161747 RepID=UPI000D38F091|nr:MoaD/ThiS family protein [Saccharospirillum mangrovi]
MRTVQLKFFARLREQIGIAEIAIPADQAPNLDKLMNWLQTQHPQWSDALQQPLTRAVNEEVVNGNIDLKPGDQVALFPPVTGG